MSDSIKVDFNLVRCEELGLELIITWHNIKTFYLRFHRKRRISITYNTNNVIIFTNEINKNDELRKINTLYKNAISLIPNTSLKIDKIIYKLFNRYTEKYKDTVKITLELISELLMNKNISFNIEMYKNHCKFSKIISVRDIDIVDKISKEIPLEKNIVNIISMYSLHLVFNA